mmetsp:Transcript_16159/g.48420  ORF Transcript_16159/g.48420 Transcript_16159/m.48420 type:complete len:211 (-) Transcript_16159:627-1259(-)
MRSPRDMRLTVCRSDASLSDWGDTGRKVWLDPVTARCRDRVSTRLMLGNSSASSLLIALVTVAATNTVSAGVLPPRTAFTTCFTSSPKPASNMVSASSSTSHRTSPKARCPLAAWPSTRLGVPTSTSNGCDSALVCSSHPLPPHAMSARNFSWCESDLDTRSSCMASSRVGPRTSTRGRPGRVARPVSRSAAFMADTTGKRYANVLPEPV